MIIPHNILGIKIFWQKVIEFWLYFISCTSLEFKIWHLASRAKVRLLCAFVQQGHHQNGNYMGNSTWLEITTSVHRVFHVTWKSRFHCALTSESQITVLSFSQLAQHYYIGTCWVVVIPGIIGWTLSQIRHTHTTLIHTFFCWETGRFERCSISMWALAEACTVCSARKLKYTFDKTSNNRAQ